MLLFTKPLGIGVLTTAAKADLCPPEVMKTAYTLMTTLNKAARDCMVRYEVHACTDVTGFGFLGHAYEMAQGSGVQLEIDTSAVDILPAALEFAKMGLLPEGMYRNRHYAEAAVDPGEVPLEVQDVLYDPQTAGGLLMAVAPGDADALYRDLQGAVPSAQRVGVVRPETAGGLLMAVAPGDADALYRDLQGAVPSAQRVGVVRPETEGGKRIILR